MGFVDPLTLGTILSVGSGAARYMSGKAQNDAQAAMYNNQAQVAEANAAITRRQQEQLAENAAYDQQKLTAQMKLARGQALAAAGGSGIAGDSGTVLDVLTGNQEAYRQDSLNLLGNLRNDTYGLRTQEYNYLQDASASKAAAANAKNANKGLLFSTLLNTAGNVWGIKNNFASVKGSKSSAGGGINWVHGKGWMVQ